MSNLVADILLITVFKAENIAYVAKKPPYLLD